jgi:phage I-like protein
MTNAVRLALTALGAAATSAPEWILLLPAGDITTRDGRVLRNVSPDTILASFAADQRDIPLDYEHATEVRAPEGLSAPAVGWIGELKVEAGEILGKVAWTDDGRAAVESRAYRYISPVVHLEPGSRAVLRISSVALTNDPALYIKSLNRREAPETQEEAEMLKAIAKALNLPETATEAEILSAIAVQHTEKEALKAKADKPDATMYVLRTEHDTLIATCSQLRAENKTLKDADTEKEVVALVDGAISAGKVIPAIRDSELELCRALGATKYQERLSKLTPTLTPGESDTTRKEPGKNAGKLDDAQKEMCRRLGLKEEDFLKNVDA